jgi:hypothetical protein
MIDLIQKMKDDYIAEPIVNGEKRIKQCKIIVIYFKRLKKMNYISNK